MKMRVQLSCGCNAVDSGCHRLTAAVSRSQESSGLLASEGWRDRGALKHVLCSFFIAAALWLGEGSTALALQWEQADGFRRAAISFPASSKAGFTLLTSAQTGIDFTNRLSDAKAAENQIRLNGSGVALGDIDGDGLCDLYVCRLEGSNALYRNLGNWRFEDITASAGAGFHNQYSTGAVLADVDGDGDGDLLVNGIGAGTRLFLNNNGKGNFTESTDAGLVRKFGATSMALADIDADGDLDLYVANYRTTTIRTTGFAVLKVGDKRMIRPEDRDHLEYTSEGRVLEHGEADLLYRNDGRGHFTVISWTDGTFLDEDGKPLIKPPFDWGLSVMFRDINGDGVPDLYVCNDFQSSDKIWLNDGKGHFRAIPPLALRHTSTFSMAVDFGDLNRDGLDDIFVADMLSLRHERRLMQLAVSDPYQSQAGRFQDRPQFDRNTFQLNRGDGTYADVACYAGLDASDWTWSAILLDVDLDGYEDLLCTTGHMFDTQDADAEARIQAKGPWRRDLIPQKLLMFHRMPQAKAAFRNRGDLTFEKIGKDWQFDQVGVAQGMAVADLDNDGDLDLVVNNLNGAVGIYRNNSPAPRIAVRLKGLPPNTRGIGAKIKLLGGPVGQMQEMICGGRYLSGDDAIRVFAAGHLTNILKIEVTWRSGSRSTVSNVKANCVYEIDETSAEVVAASRRGSVRLEKTEDHADRSTRHALPLFEDVSELLRHTHVDEPFNDFARQPLLPRKLSQLGPGVAWFDLDADGWDDLILGSGRGGLLAIYRNERNGRFSKVEGGSRNAIVTRDQTAVLGWQKTREQTIILVGSANYEDGLTNGAVVRQFDLQNRAVLDTLPGQASSCGPLALADVDGDGDLDLFVGGRCIPGRWPAPATSLIFRNENGQLELDPEKSAPFTRVGLVSGATFTDLNGDGAPDLVLACEWGPLRLFLNERGRFVEATQRWGLQPFVGWWNGVAAGDFDGDGHLDLVASNWGLNSPYQAARDAQAAFPILTHSITQPSEAQPLNLPLLYYEDFDGNGTMDLIEADVDSELNKVVPIRSLNAVAQGLPFVRDRFPSFAAFNRADVIEIVGDNLKKSKPLRATWLASTVFLNRSDHFEPVPLPPEAQFAPAFGLSVADFDGDRHEDIFLNQNFFETQPTMPRLDAGRGLLLKGDGAGGFVAVSGQMTGIRVYGEGRGAAVSDFDGDGRADLAVAQNGAATKLFRGVGGRPGLRVRLLGPPGNLQAAGAVLRLVGERVAGPARCIQVGNGYWSQDSQVVILARPEGRLKLRARWPGGPITESEVPADATEVRVASDGMLQVTKQR